MKFAQGLQGALKQGKKVQVLVWFDLDSTGVIVRGKMFFKWYLYVKFTHAFLIKIIQITRVRII